MMNWISTNWCGLTWTDWQYFDKINSNLKSIRHLPGLYRIKNVNSDELVYIGQTGNSLRKRLESLQSGIFGNNMPYNDPHTAAPVLWAYRIENQFQFEFSCCYLEKDINDEQVRKGYEDFLLWSYRLETGKTSLVNYGKKHPHYTRPTNRNKGEGLTGIRHNKPETFKDTNVLSPYGSPADKKWMGLSWEPYSIEQHSLYNNVLNAVYRLENIANNEIVYIGQTSVLKQRITTHIKTYGINNISYSYYPLENILTSTHRLQVESDLLGAFFAQNNHAPYLQYKKKTV